MNDTITPKELQTMLENGRKLTILDVRRKSDYDVDPRGFMAQPGKIRKRSSNGGMNSRIRK